jgi:hypothetical protein
MESPVNIVFEIGGKKRKKEKTSVGGGGRIGEGEFLGGKVLFADRGRNR